jgi:hypothetical protein
MMQARSEQDRRTDSWTAERIDLAVLTARAFDLHAARYYLELSGVEADLVRRFAHRYPFTLRPATPMHPCERRVAPAGPGAKPDQR